MTIESGAVLDALELRGRRHLGQRARRDALVVAVSRAAMAGIAVPLTAIPVAFARPVPLPLLAAAVVVVPVVVALVVFLTRRGSTIDRDAALALFDRAPGCKDRVRSSDEFLALDAAGGGFRAAAVAEAAPWLARALEQPLDHLAAGPAIRRALRERAPWIGGAVLLLVLAAVLGRPVATGDAPAVGGRVATGGDAGAAGSQDAVPSAPPPTLAALLANRVAARLGMASDPQRGGRGGASVGDLSTRARPADPSGDGAGAGEGEQPGATATARGGGQGAAGGGGAGSGATGTGEAGSDMAGAMPRQPSAAAGGGNGGQSETGAPPRTPSGGPNAASVANRGADSVRQAQERRAAGTEAGQASANAPGGANPPQQQNGSSAPPRPDQAGQPRSGKSGDSGAQQQQGQGNSPGQGNNSAGSAQDALKRSRGLTSLLLAVPTVDRLQGTPGDGPSRATIRRTPPQPRRADGTLAGVRGAQRGDAGVVPRRPATAHEARLVRDYFDRSGGASR